MSYPGIVALIEDMDQNFTDCQCEGSGPCDIPGDPDDGGIECQEYP